MKSRHLAAWCFTIALLGAGAVLLRAQPPQSQPPQSQPGRTARTDRDKLRAEVIKLRTETEMLRFDYDRARDSLLEDIKIQKGLKMAGGLLSAFTGARTKPASDVPQQSDQDRKKAAEQAKAEQQEEEKESREEQAAVLVRKKEMAHLFELWVAKRLDLDDVERSYNESLH